MRTQTIIVLDSVETILQNQKNSEPSSTDYFAVLSSLLSETFTNDKVNAETVASVVCLLNIVAPFAPQPLLRARFTQILKLLAPGLFQDEADTLLLRHSIGCLETLLLAQDLAAWDMSVAQIGPRRAVARLISLSMHQNPKVRRKAQEAMKTVLRNPPPSPSSDHPAADMCAQTALKTLEDLAQKSSNGAKQKDKQDLSHDPVMLHALQLIKTIASASGGWPSKKIEPLCELLLQIAKGGNQFMTMAVFDIFEMIFAGLAEDVASTKLPRLMENISDLRPSANDTQLVPPWLAILSRGYDVSAQIEPDETFHKLPDVFKMVAQFMESPSPNIRISASECLVSFMATCVPSQVILEPSIYDEKILEKLAKTAESLLSVKYQAAWLETFNVLGAMYDSLRWRAYPMMTNIAKTMGEIRSNESFRSKREADEVIGKAIRSLGPEAVLSIMPLNLARPTKGQQGRAWLLPVLRDYVSNTNLAHFKSEMVSLSEVMFQRMLEHGDGEKTMEGKIYETIVQQIWSTLPGYCDLPLDLTESFDQGFAELLANLLYQQVDLRMDICRALRILVETNQAIANIEDEEDDLVLQSRVSREQAKQNLRYLGTFAGNMLAVLFNVYTQTLPQRRGPILQTINVFLGITPDAELMETFTRVSAMLSEELQKEPGQNAKPEGDGSGSTLPSTSSTLMDLVITMSAYLPRESFGALFEIASQVIFKQDEPQLQKKAYKLIPRLADSAAGKVALRERYEELQLLLHSSGDKVSAPARRERLAAIAALLPFVPDTSLHFIPSVLNEVVVCCKENNERARETSFALLVEMGNRMLAAEGAAIHISKVPNMAKDAAPVPANIEEYFTMVSAGLAASTPHMISATVTALARILYEFRGSLAKQTLEDLIQTMDLFLTSNNREIVQSVLGFVKVCIITLTTDLMLPRLPTLIPNLIIWSHEYKGHFRMKVKHIIERIVRKFGYDIVYQNCPESDRKLIINIRKTRDRSQRKKEAAKDGVDGDESGGEGEEGRTGRRFDNEYDEALYSSESDDSGDEDIERPVKATKGSRKKVNAYIVEEEGEPLDLLDRRAMANISSTKPVRIRRPTKSKAKVDEDGKLILGQEKDDGAMDIDAPNPEESGVGAYVAALKGKDVARKGQRGKLKFSNKKGQDDGGEEMNAQDAAAVKSQLANVKPEMHKGRGNGRLAHGGRSGKGGGIAAGRRGLGSEKRHGLSMGGGIGKHRKSRRR
jgi:ribosomal RNA-processing protein 12